jgi:hypothetical protein
MAATATVTDQWTVRLDTDTAGPGEWTRSAGEGAEVVVGSTQEAEDRFAPLGVPLRYLWTTQEGVEAAAEVTVTADGPVLSSAYRPGAAVETRIVSQQPVTWQGRSIAHPVLSRRDPLVTIQPPEYHSATLRLWTSGRDATDTLLTLLNTGEPLILRTPCTAAVRDAVILPTRWTEDLVAASKPSGERWVDIEYQAVTAEPSAWPDEHEWTWEALAAVPSLTTYNDLMQQFGTWALVARGR